VRCPFCSHPSSRVIDSRPTGEGVAIRRRRECDSCGRRFTTYEYVEDPPLVVVKRGGRRQRFDRRKILAGLMKACEKRPVPVEALEAIADEVEQEIKSEGSREIGSDRIGEMVMERLKGLDEVAYVRFASVYRQFTDVKRFMEELERLIGDRGG